MVLLSTILSIWFFHIQETFHIVHNLYDLSRGITDKNFQKFAQSIYIPLVFGYLQNT